MMANKPIVISIQSAKGGTGKTSIIANLATYLASEGHKTLAVDMDLFTRGLTFFLSHGQLDFKENLCTEDILADKFKGGLNSHSILTTKQYLYLIPATSESLGTYSPQSATEVYEEGFDTISLALRIRGNLDKVIKKHGFEYVVIDARSGIDSWSLLPALIANKYIIVTEEDRTSQRASRLLTEQIDRFKKEDKRSQLSFNFYGFILNMTVNPLQMDIISFFERTVFPAPCLASISLSRQVRRSFTKDELVIDKLPGNVFSKEIKALGDQLMTRKVQSTMKRAEKRFRTKTGLRFLPVSIVSGALISIAIGSILSDMPSIVSIASLALAGIAFVLAIYYYQQAD